MFLRRHMHHLDRRQARAAKDHLRRLLNHGHWRHLAMLLVWPASIHRRSIGDWVVLDIPILFASGLTLLAALGMASTRPPYQLGSPNAPSLIAEACLS